MTLAIAPQGTGQDQIATQAEALSAAIVRQLAPHLGSASSTDEAAQIAAFVPRVKPLVYDLLVKLDAASKAATANGSDGQKAARVTASVIGALIPSLVPSAAAAGVLSELLSLIPEIAGAVQKAYAPEPVRDVTAAGIVHDTREKAVDGTT